MIVLDCQTTSEAIDVVNKVYDYDLTAVLQLDLNLAVKDFQEFTQVGGNNSTFSLLRFQIIRLFPRMF